MNTITLTYELLAQLKSVSDSHVDGPYEDFNGIFFEKFRPRMNHWHAWLGGECPLPEGFMVDVVFRDRDKGGRLAEEFSWAHHGLGSDIIAFRVTGLADSYFMPWEA